MSLAVIFGLTAGCALFCIWGIYVRLSAISTEDGKEIILGLLTLPEEERSAAIVKLGLDYNIKNDEVKY